MARKGHQVYSWGRGEDGQLGLGDTNDQCLPVFVEALKDKDVRQVACGSGHTVVLSVDGEVFTWGRGDDGRLGHGDNGWKYVPRLVEALHGKVICQVACGSYHTAAVAEDGSLFMFGGGMYGKLGLGNERGHSTPCLVESLIGRVVTAVACGSRHTVVLCDDHTVYTWGDKENGVTGHPDTDGHQYLPRRVEALRDVKATQISACGFHTAALTDGGQVYAWGEGKFGRLGLGSERNQLLPARLDSLVGHHVVHVSCGGFHTAAITDLGETFTWGGGEHGQLGHGDRVNRMSPYMVAALRDKTVAQITCGWSHTVALTDSGEVYTWGNGDHGKLGHGDCMKVTLPQRVEELHGKHVVSIASYNEHTSALCVDTDLLEPPSPLSSAFLSQLRMLVNNPDFSDVTFVVEDRAVHAHRAFLAVRCEHFRAMFSSGMRESHETEVIIPSLSYTVFLVLMDFIYTDYVDIASEHAIELYMAADLYGLDRLKSLCESAVHRLISVDTAANLLQAAAEVHAVDLRAACMKFIIRNFDDVSKTEGFAGLSRDLILCVLQAR
eukprot:PLAT4383.2.p1 GENE.PLAT4383.2~~PLAT4383.2.p1  ORF type:complete len:552 (+),score=129.47 PLAT4383.2:26-1681(+)